jgi:hypothetical protein
LEIGHGDRLMVFRLDDMHPGALHGSSADLDSDDLLA